MKAPIAFKKCVQNVQIAGTENNDDDRMVSKLFFVINVNGTSYDMVTEIRQPEGFDFLNPEEHPIEVSKPTGEFKGPWEHESLRDAASKYYRLCFGPEGSAVRFGANVQKIQMSDNTVIKAAGYMVEIPNRGGAW